MPSLSERTFTVRQQPGPPSSLSGAARSNRRIYLAADILKTFAICAGDAVVLKAVLKADDIDRKASLNGVAADGGKGEAGRTRGMLGNGEFVVGSAWPSFVLDSTSVSASKLLLENASVKEGDFVTIFPFDVSSADVLPASSVVVQFVDKLNKSTDSVGKDLKEPFVRGYIKEALVDCRYLTLHQIFEVVINGRTRKAKIIKASSAAGEAEVSAVIQVKKTTDVQLSLSEAKKLPSQKSAISSASLVPTTGKGYHAIGGLESQIEQLRELVELPLMRPDLYHHFGLRPPRGILLHGPPGTGKTLLASSVASSLSLPVFTISSSISSPYHGETESRLRSIFQEAKNASPSLVIIDEIDALAPKREDAGEVERRVVGELLVLMDGLGDKVSGSDDDSDGAEGAGNSDGNTSKPRVVVVAATNRPNALDEALRRPGRFDREIEVGIPTATARLSILNVLLRRMPCDPTITEGFLQSMASRTHGFVGADLSSLIHTAGLTAIKRCIPPITSLSTVSNTSPPPGSTEGMCLLPADLEHSFTVTRPSALREVFLETPRVYWSDIGGQAHIKQKLKESIEYPLRHPETFQRLGIRPTRGLLLYGPPGCSKTLIARALATEGGLNFIAIKGPEIYNKYVGESERAIRELFRKARAAAPCIIFLDEVDAIATNRDFDHASAGSSVGVLTTLLTEMDGIEELNGVTVLAATNRPHVIDPALMRPGRLDRILYVSPPDISARTEIFKVNLKKMAVHEDVKVDELAAMTEGCSGAEVTSVCQDAALAAMSEDLNIPNVRMVHFAAAARSVRKRITPEVIRAYEVWRDQLNEDTPGQH